MDNRINPLTDSQNRNPRKEKKDKKKSKKNSTKSKEHIQNTRDIFIHKEEPENPSYAQDPKLKKLLLKHTNKAKGKKSP